LVARLRKEDRRGFPLMSRLFGGLEEYATPLEERSSWVEGEEDRKFIELELGME